MDPRRIQRILRQHVLTDHLLGAESVPVGEVRAAPASDAAGGAPFEDDDATMFAVRRSEDSEMVRREGLDATQARPAPPQRHKPPLPTTTRPSPAPAPPAHAGGTAPSPYERPEGEPVRMIKAVDVAVPKYPQPLKPDEKSRRLQVLDVESVQACTKCGLHESRTQTVFGEGDTNAELMFVGEGPGEQEDLSGRPFVGRAGKKLDEMIAAMGLSREQVYIANIVKCRPPGNRVPTIMESDACCGFLRQQIQLVQPKAIVALGGSSAKYLLQTKKGITALRGKWHHYDGLLPEGPSIPLMPTFHPAFLLRQYTTENRRRVWEDLKMVMTLLGIEPQKK